MIAVGMDVSKGKSTVSILRSKNDTIRTPFDIPHTKKCLQEFSRELKGYSDRDDYSDIQITMECTGHYYLPVANYLQQAGFNTSTVNPLVISNYQDGISVRNVKTDSADSVKIAHFTLEKMEDLRNYIPMDTIRNDLKAFHRQYQFAMKRRTSLINNLIALTDKSFPGINTMFDSPPRQDGRQKWVDFVETYWHADCVSCMRQATFEKRYQKWCRKNGYIFSESKAIQIYDLAKDALPVLGKSDTTKILVTEAVAQLNATTTSAMRFKAEMIRLASKLPEYETVMAMNGCGDVTGPQLMAEIGDLRRFHSKNALVAFAGTDAIKSDSGTVVRGSTPTTKRGSPYLRRTLFNIMDSLIKRHPEDDPVYQFLDKKRSEGKPYYVYMTAGNTKFLRIYYGKVRDALIEKGLWEQTDTSPGGTDDA